MWINGVRRHSVFCFVKILNANFDWRGGYTMDKILQVVEQVNSYINNIVWGWPMIKEALAKRNKNIVLWAVRPVCVHWLTTASDFFGSR